MLKWLIYILLLSNIAFVTWHYRSLDALLASEESHIEQEDGLGLVLLREKQVKTQRTSARKNILCQSIGPFNEKDQAQEAQVELKNAGISSQLRLERDLSRDGYWVLLPAAESRAAALVTIARLKELKIADYFLVARREYENAISLGVFSLKESADRRMAQMMELGFSPVLENVKLPKQIYWLEWQKNSSSMLDGSAKEKIFNKYSELQEAERSCKQ